MHLLPARRGVGLPPGSPGGSHSRRLDTVPGGLQFATGPGGAESPLGGAAFTSGLTGFEFKVVGTLRKVPRCCSWPPRVLMVPRGTC